MRLPARPRQHHLRGRFTQVELIAVLILLGILASVSGMWIVTIAQGFQQSQTAADAAQKAQAAMTRITRELAAGCTISSSTATSISFSSAHYPAGKTLALSGTDLLLGPDVLIDGVSSFSVTTASGIGPAGIAVTVSFTLADTGSALYTRTVYP